MRNNFDGPLVDLVRLVKVFADILLENCVVVPQIDVSSPEPLLF